MCKLAFLQARFGRPDVGGFSFKNLPMAVSWSTFSRLVVDFLLVDLPMAVECVVAVVAVVAD